MALDKVKDDMLQDNLVLPGSTTQFPSITTTQRNALSSVQPGTMIYNSTVGKLQQYDGNNQWASIDSPPVITSIIYPTENGITATALEASGTTNVSETLIINGSNFSSTSEISVQIQVSGSYVAFASSISVNSGRTQITCTGVTKRAAADDYVIKVTNVSGLSATTTVNFSADPSFSTAASLGTAYAGLNLNKSIAFTGTKITQGATAKPTWMTVTGNTSTADNGASDTTFDATGSPAVLGGIIAAPASGNSQNNTFSIIVRDAENQTLNRDFSLTTATAPTGGTSGSGSGTLPMTTIGGVTYRYHTFLSSGTFQVYTDTVCDILIVAGGGASGFHVGGGGGGGGIVEMMNYTISAGQATITVGAGGDNNDNKGDNSSVAFPAGAGTQVVQGGGASGGWSTAEGADGANGGGDGINNSSSYANNNGGQGQGATGTYALLSQSGATITYYGGYDGGHTANFYNADWHPAAGGGGATAAGGTPANSTSDAGDGGDGKQITWVTPDALGFTSGSGTHNGVAYNTGFYFSGGGGGSLENTGVGGDGGKGGAGGGAKSHSAPSQGTEGSPGTGGINNATAANQGHGNHGGANTGGGAGGNYTSGQTTNGGSGIVVIRYAV